MTREHQSLDGQWQIAFDPGNIGKQREWMRWDRFHSDAPREYIDVPACWERFRQDYEGVGWYGHSFTAPAHWEGRSVRLHFGAVNYLTEVYVNDTAVGYHEGGYTDFWFEVGDLLRYGSRSPNTVVLRVIGPIVTQDIEIDSIGRNDMPHWRGAIGGGVWQSVQLIAASPVYVDDLFVTSDVPRSDVQIEGRIENTTLTRRPVHLRMSVSALGVIEGTSPPQAEPVAETTLPLTAEPGGTTFRVKLGMNTAQVWLPHQPFLYLASAELLDEQERRDEYSVRFGMREAGIEDDGFYLNHRKTLLKSAFFEALYPTTLAAPPDEAFVRRELQLARDAGFNLLRPWRKPMPPFVYDLADEIGMMFVGAMPIECMGRWPTMTPYAERRMRHEVRSAVRRDRNHPCIVMWEIFNEILRPELQRIKHRVSREARLLDPTRIIIDESGGFGGGAFVYPPHSLEPMQVSDVHTYPGAPLEPSAYDGLLTLGKTDEQLAKLGLPAQPLRIRSHQVPGRFLHVSEIGYGSLPDLEANCEQYQREGNPLTPDYRYHHEMLRNYRGALQHAALDDIFPTVRDFCLATQQIHATANKQMVDALRANASVHGFTIHAYTDGDWIVGAGLLDIFRNPKLAYEAAKETNQAIYLVVRAMPRVGYAPGEAQLSVVVSSELHRPIGGVIEAHVLDAEGASVWSHSEKVDFMSGATPVMSATMPTDDLNGTYTLHARLLRKRETVTTNSCQFRVIPRTDIPQTSARVAVIDPGDSLAAALTSIGVSHQPYSADTPTDRLVLVHCGAVSRQRSEAADSAADFVRRGGTAVFLELPHGEPVREGGVDRCLAPQWLPLRLLLRPTKGLWSPFAHVIREHPVSAGLPANQLMDDDYVHVYPTHSIINADESDPSVEFTGMDLWSHWSSAVKRVPVCTLGLGWKPGAITDDRDYRGPGPVTLGADLIDRPCGDGTAVLSTLRLISNIGRDPVADILLANLIAWADGLRKS